MATFQKTVAWALHEAPRLRLEVTGHKWVDNWLPGFIDFGVSIDLGTGPIVGRAVKSSEEEAFGAALSEAIEGFLKRELNLPTSSGLACHADESSARIAATREFIERDSFLCHYLTKTPPEYFDASNLSIGDVPFLALQEKLARFKVKMALFLLDARPFDGHVMMCAAFGEGPENPFELIIGLGCNETVQAASEKAVLECLKNVAAQLEGNGAKPIGLSVFSSLSEYGPSDHYRLGLDRDSSQLLTWLTGRRKKANEQKAPRREEGSRPFYRIETEIIDIDHPALAHAPLCVARAYSDEMQPLFFGPTTRNAVNLERLSQFLGRSLAFDELEPFPHIFG